MDIVHSELRIHGNHNYRNNKDMKVNVNPNSMYSTFWKKNELPQ